MTARAPEVLGPTLRSEVPMSAATATASHTVRRGVAVSFVMRLKKLWHGIPLSLEKPHMHLRQQALMAAHDNGR